MCYKALEMYAMAVSDAKTALKLTPNSVKAWYLVGECGFLMCKHSTDDSSEEIIKESVSCLLKGNQTSLTPSFGFGQHFGGGKLK